MPVWPCGVSKEIQERRPEKELGPDSGRTVRPFTFIVALCGIGACKALSKGMSDLVCLNRIILPPELRVA